MLSNCFVYNPSSHEVTKMGKKLDIAFDKRWKEFQDSLAKEEEDSLDDVFPPTEEPPPKKDPPKKVKNRVRQEWTQNGQSGQAPPPTAADKATVTTTIAGTAYATTNSRADTTIADASLSGSF